MNEETLFAEALGKQGAARAAFLDEHCKNDIALRKRLEGLLRAHDHPDPFLEAAAPAATVDEPLRESAGTTIGPYKLIEPIGEGGMGSVWMAQQTEPVKRLVAVKLIKAGMDSKQVIARFEAERQALALMDHANIARVLDADTTSAGRPYFVMDLVKGVPITRYCDKHRLTPRQRLELFVPVCQAVQHAHQKGIIHRDLKPSNVLVALYDGKPVPKVIDFGVAKATGQSLTDKTLVTGFGAIVGTLEYMSPEQAELNALDIDTRSDIYSLGVLLYELLTGSPPFTRKDMPKAGMLEMLRVIREREPSKPSTKLSTAEGLPTLAENRGTEPAKLTRLVRGELDWIVMKALEKDRNRRYETANGFAMDVQRYLADEPVLAGPPSARYRLKKFLRRNRGPVLAGMLVLLALVAGIIGTTVGLLQAQASGEHARNEAWKAGQERDAANQARDEEHKAKEAEGVQRHLAEAARDRAADTLDTMTGDIARIALTQQKAVSPEQKQFLTQALGYYRDLLKETETHEATRQRIADVAAKVGYIEYRLGHLEEALVMLRQARDLNEKLVADFPTVPKHRVVLSAHHHNLGILLTRSGKRDDAEAEYRAALDLDKRLAAEFPNDPEYRVQLASAHNALGSVLRDLSLGESEHRTALDIHQKLVAEFPAVAKYRAALADGRSLLAGLLHNLGRPDEARVEYLAVLDIRGKLATEFPRNADYRDSLATGHHDLGMLLYNWGKWDQAETEFRAALTLHQKLAAEFPADPDYRQDVAGAHDTLGNLLANEGKLDQAETEYRAALDTRKQLADEFPDLPGYRNTLAHSHHNLGMLLHQLRKLREAETELRTALDLDKKLTVEFPKTLGFQRDLANHHNALGQLLSDSGKRLDAETEYRAALDIRKQLAAAFPKSPNYREQLASGHNNLGQLLLQLRKLDEAEAELNAALDIRKQLGSDFPNNPEYAVSLGGTFCNLGALVSDRGRPNEALALFDQAIATLGSIVRKEPRHELARQFLFNSYSNRARTFNKLERHAEAAADWASALQLASVQNRPFVQNRLMISRIAAGQFESAMKDADELAKLDSPELLYSCAAVFALAHAKTQDDKHAGRAVELLRRAVAKGLQNGARLKNDTQFNSLHERQDFKQLLADLDKEK
jgi:serine/threonine protein kinase